MNSNYTYTGKNTGAGPQKVSIINKEGYTTTLKQRIVRHSPDGFQWGYGGSGPADLALNLLFDYFLRTKRVEARKLAIALYQAFKWTFIANAPKELNIKSEDIERWMKIERIKEITENFYQQIYNTERR